MAYLWVKSLHLVGVIAWFAGLFYLVRLFVYHAEAAHRPALDFDLGCLVREVMMRGRVATRAPGLPARNGRAATARATGARRCVRCRTESHRPDPASALEFAFHTKET